MNWRIILSLPLMLLFIKVQAQDKKAVPQKITTESRSHNVVTAKSKDRIEAEKYGTGDALSNQKEIKEKERVQRSGETQQLEAHPIVLSEIGESNYNGLSREEQKKLYNKYYKSFRIVQDNKCPKVTPNQVNIDIYEKLRKDNERVTVDYNKECGVQLILLSNQEVNTALQKIQ